MKRIIIFLLICFPIISYAQFKEYNIIGVVTDNAKEPVAVFFNTYTGKCNQPAICTDGEWIEVDLKDIVPVDTGAVFLSGLLIITHGMTAQTCNMTVSFRSPSSTFEDSQHGSYLGQVVEAHRGGGQRSGFASWVPVEDGVFQMKWTRNTRMQWPTSCAYGINLTVQAYVK